MTHHHHRHSKRRVSKRRQTGDDDGQVQDHDQVKMEIDEAPRALVTMDENFDPERFRVLAFGDFGETFKPIREVVSVSIRKTVPVDIGLLLGDNFYPHGLHGTKQTMDKEWKNLVDVFGPLNVPFLAGLGNHDYSGDVGQQIGFTFRDDLNPTIESKLSDLMPKFWNMPQKRYDVYLEEQDVHIFMLDTTPLLADDSVLQELRQNLIHSKAKWKICAGHHPIISDDRGYNGRLKSLHKILYKHADLYVTGHDHSCQVLSLGENKYDCGPLQVISGAVNHMLVRKFRHDFAMVRTRPRKAGYVVLDIGKDDIHIDMYEVTDVKTAATERVSRVIYTDRETPVKIC